MVQLLVHRKWIQKVRDHIGDRKLERFFVNQGENLAILFQSIIKQAFDWAGEEQFLKEETLQKHDGHYTQ